MGADRGNFYNSSRWRRRGGVFEPFEPPALLATETAKAATTPEVRPRRMVVIFTSLEIEGDALHEAAHAIKRTMRCRNIAVLSCFSKTILQEPVARADAPDGSGSTFLSNLSAYPASLTLLSPVFGAV